MKKILSIPVKHNKSLNNQVVVYIQILMWQTWEGSDQRKKQNKQCSSETKSKFSYSFPPHIYITGPIIIENNTLNNKQTK